MAGDPPLNQVVAKTWELGVRGGFGPALRWNLGAFRTENHDDILFVADNQSGFGYFRNFGKTRRQGIEAGMAARVADRAFRGELHVPRRDVPVHGNDQRRRNSSNDAPAPGFDGNIVDRSGRAHPADSEPALQSLCRLGHHAARCRSTSTWWPPRASIARGNENNQHQPDGVYYLGPGKTPGYAVVNLGAGLAPRGRLAVLHPGQQPVRHAVLHGRATRRHGFHDNGNFIARPFAAPVVDGARSGGHATFYAPARRGRSWTGVRYAFDKGWRTTSGRTGRTPVRCDAAEHSAPARAPFGAWLGIQFRLDRSAGSR